MEHFITFVKQFSVLNPAACAIFVLALAALIVVWKALHLAGRALRSRDEQ